MPGLFDHYRVALLDASFFVSQFPEDVQKGLEDLHVYVADTFNAEIAQYKAVLSSQRRAAYDANILFLTNNKQLKTLNLASFGDKGSHIYNDTWGVANLLVGLNANFVLVTADQLLIQRVVLAHLTVDIYDLNKKKFLYYKDFPVTRRHYALRNASDWSALPETEYHACEKMLLYRRNQTPIVLGKEFSSGLEANLYRVEGNQSLMAKVFKKGRLSSDKYKNLLKIQNINQSLDIPWALFPMDILFFDEQCTVPAGFTEKYGHTKGNLDENPLYLGDVDLPDEYLDTRISASLELCLKVVRQVRYLSSYGFLISDFNMGNFALRKDNGNCLQMWDTDSFGYETFFSGYCAGSRTSREYDITRKDQAIDFCNEALYLFVFTILSLGDTPISEFTGKFKFDNPNYGALYRKELFPSNLWILFEEVFRGKKPPSSEMLLQQLHIALEQCKENPAKDRTYKALLGGIIEEAAEADSGSQNTGNAGSSGNLAGGNGNKPSGGNGNNLSGGNSNKPSNGNSNKPSGGNGNGNKQATTNDKKPSFWVKLSIAILVVRLIVYLLSRI